MSPTAIAGFFVFCVPFCLRFPCQPPFLAYSVSFVTALNCSVTTLLIGRNQVLFYVISTSLFPLLHHHFIGSFINVKPTKEGGQILNQSPVLIITLTRMDSSSFTRLYLHGHIHDRVPLIQIVQMFDFWGRHLQNHTRHTSGIDLDHLQHCACIWHQKHTFNVDTLKNGSRITNQQIAHGSVLLSTP